ncbi:MAG: sigma 54-interacting transcriptional regulator [Thermoanaerobaculia bacterium]|nr:sigma 54-interacting transcriptional regulator [Thermoanaerobaculia bacterium]
MSDPSSLLDSHLEIETQAGDAVARAMPEPRVPGLTVLYHPNLERIGDRVVLTQLAAGREQRVSRLEPLFAAPGSAHGLPLASPFLSRRPLVFLPAPHGGLRLRAPEVSHSVMVDGEPLGGEHEVTADRIARGVVLLLASQVVLLLSLLDPSGLPGGPALGLVGASSAVERLRREIVRLADLEVPVLLQGETGSGKELVARALHAASGRKGPLVAVNLGAIPPSLAVAELFGALPGAFTGAHRGQPGYFRRAHRGTLFLDEVGEAPLELQAILLRVLETSEIQALGSAQPERVDVRVVCATDRALDAEVEAGRFRAPLLYRLSAARIVVPSLAERREDFGRLLVHFLRHEATLCGESARLTGQAAETKPWLPALLVARLALCDWPGNVRELANTVRQLVISGRGRDTIEAPPELPPRKVTSAPLPPTPRSPRRPREVGEDELLAALADYGGDLQRTADALGIRRASLYNLIRRSGRARTAADLEAAEILAGHARHGGDLDRLAAELGVSRRGLRRRMSQLDLNLDLD